MNNNRNSKIEEILGSLDNTPRAVAPDFFYTRLKARMERAIEPATPKSWILRPAYALVALVLVLFINAAVVLEGNITATANNNNTVGDTETFQSIAAEYSLNDNNTLYDLNQDK
jgi:hypothetical protein